MAANPSTFDSSPLGDSKVRLSRVADETRHEALSLLLSGTVRDDDPAVDSFLAFSAEHQLDLNACWLASLNGKPVATTLLIPAPGRAAMLFISPIRQQEHVAITSQLIKKTVQNQDPQSLALVQCLLDKGQQYEQNALVGADFQTLATLLYMQRKTMNGPTTLDLGDPTLEITHWSACERELFQRCILASYQDTLDCPDLVGLREIDDIIAGHMSTGDFDPLLWFAIHQGKQAVGVMLLAPIKAKGIVELVYLGLSPTWRGRGLGRKLLTYAAAEAFRQDAQTFVLAVDESNTPAIKLYHSLDFSFSTCKLALIFTLKEKD